MEELTIGKLSKLVGLPAKTIRFYEEEGLISRARRGENDYRLYSPSVIEELKVIKYARDLDLPIPEIKKLLQGCGDGSRCTHSHDYLDKYITNYLHRTDDRISELKTLKQKLNELQRRLRHSRITPHGGAYCCNIFYQIINEARKGGEKK